MKLLVVYKYVVAILLLCTSCSNYKTELKDVESYINERPDSALAFLQSIDISSVKGKSVKITITYCWRKRRISVSLMKPMIRLCYVLWIIIRVKMISINCFGRIIILEEYSRMTIGIMMLS